MQIPEAHIEVGNGAVPWRAPHLYLKTGVLLQPALAMHGTHTEECRLIQRFYFDAVRMTGVSPTTLSGST